MYFFFIFFSIILLVIITINQIDYFKDNPKIIIVSKINKFFPEKCLGYNEVSVLVIEAIKDSDISSIQKNLMIIHFNLKKKQIFDKLKINNKVCKKDLIEYVNNYKL